jgi:hypothetical protein
MKDLEAVNGSCGAACYLPLAVKVLVNLGKSDSLLIAAYGAGRNLYTGFCAGRLLLYSDLDKFVRTVKFLAAIGASEAVSVIVGLIVIGEAMSLCRDNLIVGSTAGFTAIVGCTSLSTGGSNGRNQIPGVRFLYLVIAASTYKRMYVTDGGIFLGIAVAERIYGLGLLSATGAAGVILLTVLGTGRKKSVTDLFPIVRHIYGVGTTGAHAGVYILVTLHIVLGKIVSKSGKRFEGCVIATRAGNVS